MPSAVSAPPPQPTSSKSIPPSAMPLISPSALLEAHLSQEPPTRPSNRTPSQIRQVDVNVGSLTHCNGSSLVKLGNTTIICGVRGEILPISEIPSYDAKSSQKENNVTLSPETPTALSLHNLLVPNLDMSTGCSPLHAPNTPPSTLAQSLTQRLYTLLHTSHLISSSDLEISYTPPPDIDLDLDPDDPAYIDRTTEVKAYWTLYIDMVCISYGGEGTTFDAAWLATLAALKDTILPKAWWDADLETVLCSSKIEEGKRLTTTGIPVPLSFASFVSSKDGANQHWTLLDPDAFEEESCSERGCVIVDHATKKILRIEKNGGMGVSGVSTLKEVLSAAEKRSEDWYQLLNQALVRGGYVSSQ